MSPTMAPPFAPGSSQPAPDAGPQFFWGTGTPPANYSEVSAFAAVVEYLNHGDARHDELNPVPTSGNNYFWRLTPLEPSSNEPGDVKAERIPAEAFQQLADSRGKNIDPAWKIAIIGAPQEKVAVVSGMAVAIDDPRIILRNFVFDLHHLVHQGHGVVIDLSGVPNINRMEGDLLNVAGLLERNGHKLVFINAPAEIADYASSFMPGKFVAASTLPEAIEAAKPH